MASATCWSRFLEGGGQRRAWSEPHSWSNSETVRKPRQWKTVTGSSFFPWSSPIDASEVLVRGEEQLGYRFEGGSAALELADPELFAGRVAGAAEEVTVISVEHQPVRFGGGQEALGQRCSTRSRRQSLQRRGLAGCVGRTPQDVAVES